MKVDDIHPTKSPAYSPNLHAWLGRHRKVIENTQIGLTVWRAPANSRLAQLYGHGDEQLVIGYCFDGDFIGSKLVRVLCHGAKEQSMSYTGCAKGLEALPDFWMRYLSVGRCAIDPEHREHFIGDRYQTTGDVRECRWCGARHQIKTETVLEPRTVTTYEPLPG